MGNSSSKNNNKKLNQPENEQTLIKDAKKIGILTDDDDPKYIHFVEEQEIDCPHLIESQTKDPSKCPIYHQMMEKQKFSQKNLDHLHRFMHFKNE